jgi:16S rRNA C967 or C1407 C5-methylase (RsmB/RsmF family)
LTKAETTEVVAAFNASQPEFEPLIWEEIKLAADGSALKNISQLTIWPQELGGNGMFIAGWRRKKAPSEPSAGI